jgi:hypothetical protein
MYTVATGRYFIGIIMMSKLKLLMTALVTVTAVNATAPTRTYYPGFRDAVIKKFGITQADADLVRGISVHDEKINGTKVTVIDVGSLNVLTDKANLEKLLGSQLREIWILERKIETVEYFWVRSQGWNEPGKPVELAMDSYHNVLNAIAIYSEENYEQTDQMVREALLEVIKNKEMYLKLFHLVVSKYASIRAPTLLVWFKKIDGGFEDECNVLITENTKIDDMIQILTGGINWCDTKIDHDGVAKFLSATAHLQDLQNRDRWNKWLNGTERTVEVAIRLLQGSDVTGGEALEFALNLLDVSRLNQAERNVFEAALSDPIGDPALLRQVLAATIVRASKFGLIYLRLYSYLKS